MLLIIGLSVASQANISKCARPFFGSITILEISTENAPTIITGINVINAALMAIIYRRLLNELAKPPRESIKRSCKDITPPLLFLYVVKLLGVYFAQKAV